MEDDYTSPEAAYPLAVMMSEIQSDHQKKRQWKDGSLASVRDGK